MRVLLVSANREHFPEPVFPVGIAYLANAILSSGAEVEIFDAGAGLFPHRALRRRIEHLRPDVVGLSLRNSDSATWPCTLSYADGYRRLAGTIRAASGVPLILGGPAFSIFPEEFLRLLRADSGFVGDGEAGTSLFLRGERGEGNIERGRVPSLDEVRFPASLTDIFPSCSRYRTFGVQTARGCPHRCLYCTYPLLEGGSLRARPPEEVVEDMRLLYDKIGARSFFIVDATFNAEEERMISVLDALRASGMRLRFSCYMTPKVSDPGIFRLLAAAGCVGVDFGTDSGSPSLLSTLRKSFSVDDIHRASEGCRRAGIDFCHSLIFGGPGETAATIEGTARLMDETSPRAVIAMVGMRIYPGTGLAERAEREGVRTDGRSLFEPLFYFAEIGRDAIRKEVSAKAAARRNWFVPGSRNWSASPGPKLLRLLHRAGPLWRHLKKGS